MNWKLIIQLASFGIAMGMGTAFFIPPGIEPVLWLVLFTLSAYAIARRCAQRRFLNGLAVGLLDSLLKTAMHVLFFAAYADRHPATIASIQRLSAATSPRTILLLSSPVWGLTFGAVIGLFAMLLAALNPPRPIGTAGSRL
jgi:hypothetical protein